MATPRGMLTLDDLRAKVDDESIDTVVVAFTDHYGRLMGKRYDPHFFLEDGAHNGTHACDYLLTVDMDMEPIPGYDFANWELGYGDFHLVPDLDTLRVATWLERTALVLCDVVGTETHERVAVAPRSILRHQLERAADLGYEAFVASELEYYLYADSYREASEKGYANLETVGWYIEDYHLLQGSREEFFNGALRRHLARSGVPIENSKGEFGHGQHELNVRYADALTMADRHVLYKQCAKDLADQLEVSVTFMAKPLSSEAGSSCHVHTSLWKDGANVFPGDVDCGPITASDEFRWFLGGWMKHVGDLLPMLAPTINSYKRFQDGSWAPTRVAWSKDNRTAGFRVVGEGDALRIECRIPGADCNPYLTFAAFIAAGLDGIEQRIEPPDAFEGDVYSAEDLPRVPRTLRDATERFRSSTFVKDAFGSDVQDHYTHFFEVEQRQFDEAVTDWERQRYFERI